ncbi:MAG: site-2 protease family protein [Planctomycetota bacterium]
MFGRRISLFRLFGFSVRIDMSWLIIALLVTWTLASGYFPSSCQGLTTAVYWVMGLCGALGLFASVVFHELCHSLAARLYGVSMKGITLFIFGGVAEMEEEPPSPQAEFVIAIAGPASSVLLALAFFLTHIVGGMLRLPQAVLGVVHYLAFINTALVIFNLIPGFPLDGGRILRSALWRLKGNLRWATRIASNVGAGFGMVLIILGVFHVLFGSFIAGMWWFLIGMFLRGAAHMSYQHLLIRRALLGETVRRFMTPDVVAAPSSITIEELVDDYIYRHHYKMFPVSRDGVLCGCVTTRQVRQIPREEWGRHTIEEIAEPCSDQNTIHPDDDAMRALSKMNRNQISRLLVTEGDVLVGIVSLKDLLGFLALKMELEGEEGEVPNL